MSVPCAVPFALCSSQLMSYKPRPAGPGPALAPIAVNPSFHWDSAYFFDRLLPLAGTFRCIRYPTTDLCSSLSPCPYVCPSSSLHPLLIASLPSPIPSGPPFLPSSTLCDTTTAYASFIFLNLGAPSASPYDVGFFSNSCAPLDFEADITANQTVSPSTDTNVTAGNRHHSSHLIISSLLARASSRLVRLNCA